MSGTMSAYTMQGSSRVVKSETRTITKGGVTSTVTEVVNIQSNGSKNESVTTITKTEQHRQLEIRRDSHSSSGSSSAHNSFSEKMSKNKMDSFFGKFRGKSDKKEKSTNKCTSIHIRDLSSDSESDNKRQAHAKQPKSTYGIVYAPNDNKTLKTYSVTTNTTNTTSSDIPKTVKATVTVMENHKKAERRHSGSSSNSSPEIVRQSKIQSLISKFSLKDNNKTPQSKPAKPSLVKSGSKHQSSSSSESDTEDDFADACLKHHNYYRAKHGVPNLKLSKSLCKYSQEWANRCAREGRFEHRQDHKYGENIYSKWNSDPKYKISGKEPVDEWYSEIKKHTFGAEPRSMGSGHFTQVIWKESKELGVGIARGKTGQIYVVANYDPPGNMIGSFTANVPRPKMHNAALG